jgi:hypothetical protein
MLKEVQHDEVLEWSPSLSRYLWLSLFVRSDPEFEDERLIRGHSLPLRAYNLQIWVGNPVLA